MKKTFPYDEDTAGEGVFGPPANAGNWTDAGDNFPQAAFAGTTTSATLVLASAPAAATIPQLADWLVNGFWSYEGTSAHHWASTTITYNINGLNSAEKFLAQSAMQAWHEVANVNFVQKSGSANITFIDSGSMTAVTYADWTNSGIMTSATVDISSDWIANDGGALDGKTGIDSYGYQTYIHEIGHALGLGHQGPYNGSASYSTDAIFANDTWQYSIMSYFSENNYSGSTYRYVVTPQMADIYAVDQIYGVASTRTGNTTYGFHSNAGSIFDFTQYGAAPALTIYDSGGNDTLDCSGYSSSQTIDLHPGAFSSVGGLVHNIGISTNTVIENAIGGNGNDTLIANDFGCTLSGGAGNDTLIGGAGNDTLRGGTGADRMTGGGGADNFVFAAGDSTASQPDLITDFISGVDHIDLSTFDAITATPAVDQFYFVGTAAFNGTAGVLDYFYNSSLGVTVLQGDTNGDNVTDFVLDLTGNIALSLTDLIGAYSTPIVVEAQGSTSLIQLGGSYFFFPVGGSAGPQFKYGGTPVFAGQFGVWTVIGAEQISGGYEVALHLPGSDQYTVWGTDNTGNVVSNLAGGIVSGTNGVLESLETSFHQDLNGDGTIGVVATAIELAGSIELAQIGNNYYFNPIGGGVGPQFKYGGTPVTAGQFGSWSFIGAEQISGGYEVALHLPGSDQYTVWGTDNTGNVVSNLAGGIVSGTNGVLESLETSFHQDLNGDGVIGPVTTTIESLGSTALVQVGNDYFFNPIGGGIGPQFKYGGAPVTFGQFGSWTFIGAEQISGGYEVALHLPSSDQYTVWGTDSTGNVVSNLAGGIVSGTNGVLESLETSFHQDLNSDGVIGPVSTTIESLGSTALVQVGNDYFFNPIAGGIGPQFKYGGSAVTAGQFGSWTFIGAEQISGGYEVALHLPGSDQYTVWGTDNTGNVVSNLAGGIVSGTSSALESLETSFHQDLNSDGVIGIVAPAPAPGTVIESFGSTALVQVGSNYYFNPVGGGSGPEFLYGGTPVTSGEFGNWTFTGVEQISGGYEVALHLPGSDQYTVWGTDNSGNVISNLTGGIVSGTNSTLRSLEASFHQDLNGDGVISVNAPTLPAVPQGSLAQNDTFTFVADLGANGGTSAAPETFEFNGAAATAAGHELASLFNPAAAETQYLQQLVAGNHDALAYFAHLEGSSPADIQVTQTQHGFIIH